MRGPIAWVARLGAFVYGVYYSAIDLLTGIGAGRPLSQGLDRHNPAVSALFRQGNALGDIGNIGLLASCVLLLVSLLPGAVYLLAGACLFMQHHT